MSPAEPEAVRVGLAAGAFGAICDQMGAALVRAAHSANIKERRDCSTAVFDSEGNLVMQAEHIPVHLGSMPASVAEVARQDQAPGRSWFLNDPYHGGSHLPDLTVVTPAFGSDGSLIGYAANRAHHADVGGNTPGSMPADSRTLGDEGVVIQTNARRHTDGGRWTLSHRIGSNAYRTYATERRPKPPANPQPG